MKTLLKRAYEAWVRARRRSETERQLASLDARMLKDIGLESWKSEQGARLWALRTLYQ